MNSTDPQAEHPSPPDLATELAHRIEEASLNAWPALQQILLDGWILRFSKGFTKRANSVVPLYASTAARNADTLLEKIRYCENLYSREALQTVFRLTSITEVGDTASLDSMLDARGYRRAETSLVLTRALPPAVSDAKPAPPEFQLRMLPLGSWLTVYCQLTGMAEPSRDLHSTILQQISGHCGFATLWHDDSPVACGLAVVEHDLVGLFDIYTDTVWRNLGVGHQLVQALLQWGAEQGAARAYLQVLADNAPAAKLYADLGFDELYRYWYRLAND